MTITRRSLFAALAAPFVPWKKLAAPRGKDAIYRMMEAQWELNLVNSGFVSATSIDGLSMFGQQHPLLGEINRDDS